MIYVFLVDTGTMLTFDMNLALESVFKLKATIESHIQVPIEKQVLLASGGVALDNTLPLCYYSAGTDTSPVFLFSKVAIEHALPPLPSVDYPADDLKGQVEGCLNMPASYNTVVARTQLAQQFHDQAMDIVRTCTRLVHDQHLQQQGWAAVVANLEDIILAFRARQQTFEENFEEFLKAREDKVEILKSFDEDLKLLEQIPVFPELLKRSKEEDEEEQMEEGKEVMEDTDATVSLLDWISQKDSQRNIRDIGDLCHRGLAQMGEDLLKSVKSEVNAVITEADRSEMKEVKGLGERLFGLEQLMSGAQTTLQEQGNFAQALLKNQDRAGKVNDPSIFPDLCTSHIKNLRHMLMNHNKLQDIMRRCIKAKEELSENLHMRLKWIVYIERKLYELDTKIALHLESSRRLSGLLHILEQLHLTPQMYARSLAEAARRHHFNEAYKKWAGPLALQSSDVWQQEVDARHHFLKQFSPHFLTLLFPYLEHFPPDFSSSLSLKFDLDVPKIRLKNLEELKTKIPQLATHLGFEMVDPTPKILQEGVAALSVPAPAAPMLDAELLAARRRGAVSRERLNDTKKLVQKLREELNEIRSLYESSASSMIDKMQNLEEFHNNKIGEIETERVVLMEKQAILEANYKERERVMREESERQLNEERRRHKEEVDSLRSRFRMMTTTTPTCSSSPSEDIPAFQGLEKMKEEREREIEERISLAIQEERELTSQLTAKLTRDKERVIEDLRIRIGLLTEQVEGRGDEGLLRENKDLKVKISELESRITSLDNELTRIKRFSFVSTPEVQSSVAAAAAAAHHTDKHSDKCVVPAGVSLWSCQSGDTVLVVFDARHSHYKVLLEGAAGTQTHFLHSDSYTALGLNKERPYDKLFCLGEVISKEYCQAKKDDNRFKVAKGTRFYRVLLKEASTAATTATTTAITTSTTAASTTTSNTTAATATTTTEFI